MGASAAVPYIEKAESIIDDVKIKGSEILNPQKEKTISSDTNEFKNSIKKGEEDSELLL